MSRPLQRSIIGGVSLVLLGLWQPLVASESERQPLLEPSYRVLSLNPCYDDWLRQWLPPAFQVIPSTEHGGRLERILSLRPDYVVHNNFTRYSLLQALQKHQQRFDLVALEQPNSWSQWVTQVQVVGSALQREEEAFNWLQKQQQQLQLAAAQLPESMLIVMPNQYTWAADSWIGNLLRHFGRHLQTPAQTGMISQMSLEELIRLEPQLIVFEGFSRDYARANDWFWHGAIQRWRKQYKSAFVAGEIASCPAINAVAYLTSMGVEQ